MPVESTEENNDIISRSEAVGFLEAEYVRFSDGSKIGKKISPGLLVAIETVRSDVTAIPTVEKRRAARWNHNPNNGWEFICSACCKRTRMVRVIGRGNGQQLTENEKYNFCPRCGAKMENPMPMFKEG
jgi:rubrerythrin